MHQESLSMKMSKQFPLNALRVFEAVARLGSFTRAGEELGMTQTAVSYQVKLIEENVGEPLFLRRPRQIALTDVGQRLAPRVTEAFEMLQEAVSSARGDIDSTLLISSTPTFASQWLARNIGSFQLAHPTIAVRLDTNDNLVDFAKESTDLAIRSGAGVWPGLDTHPLMRVEFSPMLSPALAETVGGIHEPRDLLKLRIIDAGDPWWRLWFAAAGVLRRRRGARPALPAFRPALQRRLRLLARLPACPPQHPEDPHFPRLDSVRTLPVDAVRSRLGGRAQESVGALTVTP